MDKGQPPARCEDSEITDVAVERVVIWLVRIPERVLSGVYKMAVSACLSDEDQYSQSAGVTWVLYTEL